MNLSGDEQLCDLFFPTELLRDEKKRVEGH